MMKASLEGQRSNDQTNTGCHMTSSLLMFLSWSPCKNGAKAAVIGDILERYIVT